MENQNSSFKTMLSNRKKFNTSVLKQIPHYIKPREVIKTKMVKGYTVSNYSLPERERMSKILVQTDNFLLPYKQYLKIQNNKSIKENKCKVRQQSFDSDGFDCKMNVYNDFYKYSLSHHRNPLFRSIEQEINDLLRLNVFNGYRSDNLLNIQIDHIQEQKNHKIAMQMCSAQAKYFYNFMSDDYKKTLAHLEKGNCLEELVNHEVEEFKNLVYEEFIIRSKLIGLDYKHNLQLTYGRFLYYLSPPFWRAEHREFARSVEIKAKGFDLGNKNDGDPFEVIFKKLQIECSERVVKPVLYFTNPKDLVDVFNGIEEQQMHYFVHITHLTPLVKTISKDIKSLKEIIFQDTIKGNKAIKDFESILELMEERSNHLKKRFFEIIIGTFYESSASPVALSLIVNLEFCYGKIYDQKPFNLDFVSMAKAIENFYMEYSKSLDTIHSDKVKKAISQYVALEKAKLKRAKNAEKELLIFKRLEATLQRAFKTTLESKKSYKYTKKEIATNSVPHVRSHVDKHSQKGLTEDELEYLNIFTDWNDHEDPTNYFKKMHEDTGKFGFNY